MQYPALLVAALLACSVSPARGDDISDWWQAYLTDTRLVALPDGKQLSLLCMGQGSPVVVMDAGLGYVGMIAWRKVQAAVGRVTTACTYDRAGIGKSAATDSPRDAGVEADDLAALLQAAALPAPYVIVGLSYGGYITRLYVGRHREDVAGLVLVDPSSAYQSVRFAQAIPAMADQYQASLVQNAACAASPRPAELDSCQQAPVPDLPPELSATWNALFDPVHASHVAREFSVMRTLSSDLLEREKTSLGSLPFVLLNRDPSRLDPTLSEDEGLALERLWLQMHMEIMDLSSASQLHIVPGADHVIHNNRPDAVITEINDMVLKVRAR